MGVKKKTFERLRDFSTGVEDNISGLMSAYKAAKVTWRHHDGFCARTLTYNLMRMTPL
jgi:hypothetical protein